jgi:hypothetical protein
MHHGAVMHVLRLEMGTRVSIMNVIMLYRLQCHRCVVAWTLCIVG